MHWSCKSQHYVILEGLFFPSSSQSQNFNFVNLAQLLSIHLSIPHDTMLTVNLHNQLKAEQLLSLMWWDVPLAFRPRPINQTDTSVSIGKEEPHTFGLDVKKNNQSKYLGLWHVNRFIPNPSYTLQAMVFKRSSWIFYLQRACNVGAWILSPFSITLLVNGTQLVASRFLGLPVGDKVTAVHFHQSNHRGETERCYQRESSLSFALLYWQVGPLVGWNQPWKKWGKCP